MTQPPRRPILQETLWGPEIGGALWPFQPLGWHYLRPLHLHDQPELLFMRSGSLRLILGRETFVLRPGQLVWIAPSIEHRVDQLTSNVDFWSLQLEPWLIERALSEFDRRGEGARSGFLHELPSTPVVEPARRYGDAIEVAAHAAWSSYLAQTAEHPPLDARFSWMPRWQAASSRAAQDKLIAVFHAALAATRSEATALPKRCVARLAFDALLRDPTLSRHELGRLLDVSEGHLSRRFPEIFGASLVSQRARLRLTRFLTLAKASTSANLLHSALEAGFGSYAQLHRVFTGHSAFSPSGYLQGRGLLAAGTVVRAN